MKLNLLNHTLFAIATLSIMNFSYGQKKGDKSVVLLNYTFEDFIDKSTAEISEAGGITLLDNMSATFKDRPADLFYGASDYGTGINMYGFAKPISAQEDNLTTNDRLYFSDAKAENLKYAGIVTYKPGKLAKEKTYISIAFTDAKGKPVKMTPGKTYCVEMAVSLAEASKYATNNIGLMFPKNISELSDMENDGFINAEEGRMMLNYKNRVYNSYSGWDKVCGIYKAKGDETGVVIGNFYPNEKTNAEVQKKITKLEDGAEARTVVPIAYYFIDNVRIKEVDNKTECHCFKADTVETKYEFSTVVYSKEPVVSDKMTLAEKMAVHTAYYSFGKATLTATGKNCVNYIAEQLNANPTLKITVIAHNDVEEERMSVELEELISMDKQRGDLVKALLIKAGITEDRISVEYKGSTINNALESDSDDEDELKWAKNRRIEFRIGN